MHVTITQEELGLLNLVRLIDHAVYPALIALLVIYLEAHPSPSPDIILSDS